MDSFITFYGIYLFLWNILTGINAGKMELKFNIDHKHGNRIYSRDFLLSQCDQIRRGEI